jgi:hypothetical protein
MFKLRSTVAAAVAVLAATILTNRADAMTIVTPAALRGAIEDIAVTEKVHCVPGWLHHNWNLYGPTWDGCYGYRRGLLWAPPLYFGHRFHRYPHAIVGHRFVGGQRFHYSSGARFSGARFGGARMGGMHRGH